MLKKELQKYENNLKLNNYESDDNTVSLIEIGYFLVENNIEIDFINLKQFANMIFESENDDYDLDCDNLTSRFKFLFKKDSNTVIKLLKTNIKELFNLICKEC